VIVHKNPVRLNVFMGWSSMAIVVSVDVNVLINRIEGLDSIIS
jgi:hypothetical protein